MTLFDSSINAVLLLLTPLVQTSDFNSEKKILTRSELTINLVIMILVINTTD